MTNLSKVVATLAYFLWSVGVLAFAWATMPYLIDPGSYIPPAWLADLVKLMFYRNYVF